VYKQSSKDFFGFDWIHSKNYRNL